MVKAKYNKGNEGIVLNIINNLYTVLTQDLEQVTIKLATEDHPVFKAHFPNNPILPGFAQIDIIAKDLNDTIVRIEYCKFIAHLRPRDIMLCTIATDQNQRSIKIFKNEKKVSEICYESK